MCAGMGCLYILATLLFGPFVIGFYFGFKFMKLFLDPSHPDYVMAGFTLFLWIIPMLLLAGFFMKMVFFS